MHNRYLLDTCALIWLVQKSDRISLPTRQALGGASEIFISPVTAWEIAVKYDCGKLKLPLPPAEWFRIAVENFGLSVLPLDWRVLVKSVELPHCHNDPADRAIIASAMESGLTIVTGDRRFAEYDVEVII